MKPILHVKINNARAFGKCDQMHKFAKSLKIMLGGFYDIVFTLMEELKLKLWLIIVLW